MVNTIISFLSKLLTFQNTNINFDLFGLFSTNKKRNTDTSYIYYCFSAIKLFFYKQMYSQNTTEEEKKKLYTESDLRHSTTTQTLLFRVFAFTILYRLQFFSG